MRAVRAAVAAMLTIAAVSQTIPANTVTQDTRACQGAFAALPFCNVSLSLDERVNDLIERIWATNASIIPPQLTARNFGASAIPALGVPEYDWGLNSIHGVQSSCVSDGDGVHCPTSFMNPNNFGSSWNKSMARELGYTIAVESRALWLAGAVEAGPRNHIGLDHWSPNINIAKDPRWGRSCEVPSEDPLINGDFGAQYSLGLQLPGLDGTRLAGVATLKHWDAYDLENSDNATRHNFNAVVSPYALASTYFPAFKKSVIDGGALGVMCSYNAVNGVPTCASPMLTKVLRDAWGFSGYVTSDSGALEDIYSNHHYAPNALATVPVALRDGQCDVCSGGVYSGSLLAALAAGTIAREDVDLALSHTLRLRFRLGLFDPPSATPYWSVPLSSVATPRAQAANMLAALESVVLLKNDGTLPLAKGKKIAVIGPHGNATLALVGNYLGQICPSNKFECIVSPFMALQAANTGGSVTYTQGCEISKNDTSGFPAALAAAAAADVVVLALGIDGSVEGESHDRTSIDLPGAQHALAAAVAAVGKPTALFVLHGGAVDLTAERDAAGIGAIIDGGYAGFLGGAAIAATLLGDNDNLGGKLAATVYPASYTAQISEAEMELDVGVGRGYRFYGGPVVWPFGYGLSLTTFALAPVSSPPAAALVTEAVPSATLTYVVSLTNTGARAGDDVVQAYFAPQSTPSQPASKLIKQLFAYERVHLAPGASAQLTFAVDSATLRLVDRASGDTVSAPGSFDIIFTDGNGQTLHNAVTVAGAQVTVERFPGAD